MMVRKKIKQVDANLYHAFHLYNDSMSYFVQILSILKMYMKVFCSVLVTRAH